MKTGAVNSACGFESHGFRSETHSPVVQRQRLLAYTQATVVQVHPGLLGRIDMRNEKRFLRILKRDIKRTGNRKRRRFLKTRRFARFDSCLWALTTRLGRQLADHLGLEPGMLWVRLPPELLKYILSSRSSLECSPPCHGWRSWVQIPSGTLR